MRGNQELYTLNYLRYCYTCPDAHRCDQEAKCLACWEEKGKAATLEKKADTTTEDLLRLYAL